MTGSGTGHDDHAPYRLYRRQWVTVFTIMPEQNDKPVAVEKALRQHFDDFYAGRVNLDDVHLTMQPDIAKLRVRVPTCVGEFKDGKLAFQYAEKRGWYDFHVVERDSADDIKLQSYGVKMVNG